MSETEDMVGELYRQQNNAYYKAGVEFERERIIALLQPIADACDDGKCDCLSASSVIAFIKGEGK
jgi:hypothetical protein